MKRLFFVRHGLSVDNVKGIFSGQSESELTLEGKNQAKMAGRQTKENGWGVDLIISSPQSRAYDTAVLIAKEIGYPVKDIQRNELFKERSFGVLEGTPSKEFFDAYTYKDLDNAPGAESVLALQGRAKRALDHINSLDADNILIVGHGAFGRAIRRTIHKESYTAEYANPLVRIQNGEVVELV